MSGRKKRLRSTAELWAEWRRAHSAEPSPVQVKTERACQKYRMKLAMGLGHPRSDGDIAGQVARWRAARLRTQNLTEIVKALLCAEGMPVCQFINYYAFTYQVAKMRDSHPAGRTPVREAAVLRQLYVGRGLTLSILEKICEQVLSIPLVWPEDCPA